MKIAFNRKIINGPFGGGNQILSLLVSFLKGKGYDIVFNLEPDVDLIFMMEVRDNLCNFTLDQIDKHLKKYRSRIILRINENTVHREGNSIDMDKMIMDVYKRFSPNVIFISNYLKGYFESKGLKPDGCSIIANGSDRNIFKCNANIRQDKTPIKIITHHWSNNMAKGYRVYDKLSEYCHKNPNTARFSFMGNCPAGMMKYSCIIPPQPYVEIPKYLSQNDLYVSASLYEPGGCHIVEGMSCGLIPVVIENSGGCKEYSSGYNMVFRDGKELIDIIEMLYNNYGLFVERKNKMKEYIYGSEDMCRLYLKFIEELK